MKTTSDPIARLLRIHGLVQGVGYRNAMHAEARRLGLAGWVRNRLDGTVEALVAGPPEAIDHIVTWCHHGPPAAHVSRVDSQPDSAPPATGFTREPTR